MLARAAVKELDLEKLIVMPTHIQPFKMGKKPSPDNDRLNMCRLAFEDDERIEVSDYEINEKDVSYTCETLQFLKDHYPEDTELVFIMGTDSFLTFESWYEGKSMLKKYSLACSIRPGYKENELFERKKYYESVYGTKVYVVQEKMPDISSTYVRNQIINGNDVSLLLNNKVKEYIERNGLYKSQEENN